MMLGWCFSSNMLICSNDTPNNYCYIITSVGVPRVQQKWEITDTRIFICMHGFDCKLLYTLITMKLKLHHSAPLEMPFPMISFFVKVKIFIFWLKTMDYSQGFCSKLTSFLWSFYPKWKVLWSWNLHNSAPLVSKVWCLAKIKFFLFRTKTVDYSQVTFWGPFTPWKWKVLWSRNLHHSAPLEICVCRS